MKWMDNMMMKRIWATATMTAAMAHACLNVPFNVLISFVFRGDPRRLQQEPWKPTLQQGWSLELGFKPGINQHSLCWNIFGKYHTRQVFNLPSISVTPSHIYCWQLRGRFWLLFCGDHSVGIWYQVDPNAVSRFPEQAAGGAVVDEGCEQPDVVVAVLAKNWSDPFLVCQYLCIVP